MSTRVSGASNSWTCHGDVCFGGRCSECQFTDSSSEFAPRLISDYPNSMNPTSATTRALAAAKAIRSDDVEAGSKLSADMMCQVFAVAVCAGG